MLFSIIPVVSFFRICFQTLAGCCHFTFGYCLFHPLHQQHHGSPMMSVGKTLLVLLSQGFSTRLISRRPLPVVITFHNNNRRLFLVLLFVVFCLYGSTPFSRNGSAACATNISRSFDRKTGTTKTTRTDLASFLGTTTTSTTKRRACSLYVWDFPSAVLSKWYNHLIQDCIYEGRGGKKFVRIEPGSVMQLLFPHRKHFHCDRCLLCGGRFVDHLTLWWAKHLYTPYDLYLDRTSRDGVHLKIEDDDRTTEAPPREHVYHRKYVLDPRELPQSIKAIKQELKERYPGKERFEIRQAGDIHYAVPAEEISKESRKNPLLLSLVRSICLQGVDRLIQLQASDNSKQNTL